MEWTREAPTKPGWYWFRAFQFAQTSPHIVAVGVGIQGELQAWRVDHSNYLPVDHMRGEWAGPLVPPEPNDKPFLGWDND